jgi:hypothetical protein
MEWYTPGDYFMEPDMESIEVVNVVKRYLHSARFKSTNEHREEALYACRAVTNCLYPSERTFVSRLVVSSSGDDDDDDDDY